MLGDEQAAPDRICCYDSAPRWSRPPTSSKPRATRKRFAERQAAGFLAPNASMGRQAPRRHRWRKKRRSGLNRAPTIRSAAGARPRATKRPPCHSSQSVSVASLSRAALDRGLVVLGFERIRRTRPSDPVEAMKPDSPPRIKNPVHDRRSGRFGFENAGTSDLVSPPFSRSMASQSSRMFALAHRGTGGWRDAAPALRH